jgi:hypothetical protein
MNHFNIPQRSLYSLAPPGCMQKYKSGLTLYTKNCSQTTHSTTNPPTHTPTTQPQHSSNSTQAQGPDQPKDPHHHHHHYHPHPQTTERNTTRTLPVNQNTQSAVRRLRGLRSVGRRTLCRLGCLPRCCVLIGVWIGGLWGGGEWWDWLGGLRRILLCGGGFGGSLLR